MSLAWEQVTGPETSGTAESKEVINCLLISKF